MESIKNTLNELTQHFNNRMMDFHNELRTAIPATSPMSNINAQFNSFRSFVLTALENLQLQVELLSKQQDELEMRMRRKIILIHGVAEDKKEDTSVSVAKVLSDNLKTNITVENISRSHRMGRPGNEKPRAILVKFRDVSLRDKVWFSKTSLKGTGLTISEFLTKRRHETFLAARECFGVTKCWSRDGVVVVMGTDGTRHRITTLTELKAISLSKDDVPTTSTAPVVAETVRITKSTKDSHQRPKRTVLRK